MDTISEELHRYSLRNRDLFSADHAAGCFHCMKEFMPKQIVEWVDDDRTALCPYCGIDSVIPDPAGLVLRALWRIWFTVPA